jgi:hypothetical protein
MRTPSHSPLGEGSPPRALSTLRARQERAKPPDGAIERPVAREGRRNSGPAPLAASVDSSGLRSLLRTPVGAARRGTRVRGAGDASGTSGLRSAGAGAYCHAGGVSVVEPGCRPVTGARRRVTRGAARKICWRLSAVHTPGNSSVQVTKGETADDPQVSPAVSTCRHASIHRLVHKLCRSACTRVLDGDPSGFLTSSPAAAGRRESVGARR